MAMLVRSSSSERIDFVMLIFSLDFHVVLWALETHFFSEALLEVNESIRCLSLSLESKVLELNLI